MFFFLRIRRPPRSTLDRSSAASDVYKRQDRHLIEAAGFLINERVDIYNIDTGARFSTYVIEAPAGSGVIGLNGAAARLAMAGDKLIVVAYASFDGDEARKFQPRGGLVHEKNCKM